MNQDKAKRILLACRPGTSDQDDPDVRDALDLVGHDDGLAAWWRQQQAVHEGLHDAFHAIPVPGDLRDRILADRKILRPVWWRSMAVQAAAVAAVLVIVLGITVLRPRGDAASLASFRDRMVRTVVREYRMEITTSNEGEIRQFLGGERGHPDFRLRPGMQKVPLFGAGRLSWHGQPVSMVCFERQTNVLMYLFVIQGTALPDAPGPMPQFETVSRLATASWSDGDKVYVLASDAGMSDLQALMK